MYATLVIGEGAVDLVDGQTLCSYAYETSDVGDRTSMWWQISN